jgi:glucose-1-phosphate thymidylyltransferase
MQIIIPMAGYGKRLRPHTFSQPKPLINVAGEPMLKYILDALAQIKIDEYIFIVGHLGEQIEEYIHQYTDVKAHFVTQEEMIGQSHAVYLARDYIDGPGMVLFADTLFEADLSVIEKTDADGLAFIKEVEDPRRFGVVELDPNGRVTRFIEKPDSQDNKQVVIGFYYIRDTAAMLKAIEKQIAEKRMTKNEYFLTDTFQLMVDNGATFRTSAVDTWLDCGKPETVLETNRYLLEHGRDTRAMVTQKNIAVIPPVYDHPSARVENSVIGPHATISANCVIEHSIISNSVIDAGAEVKNSLLHGSLVGRDAKVSGHFQTLNIGDESYTEG